MSLYSHQFDLLPRPSRSLLSIGHETTRAQLPDFATVAELDQFVYRLFVFNLGQVPALFVQMKVAACFISFVLFLVLLIIARRMYERSFWLLRFIKRDSGRVIVPNAILCFSIIEGVYAAVFITLQWVASYSFNEKTMRPFQTLLWILLPWCPLLVGAMWATWGTYFAIPAQMSNVAFERRPLVHRLMDHAVVTNLLGLYIPLSACVSVLVPAIIADLRWNTTFRLADEWRARYAGQTEFTQTMVQEAQMVWYDLLRSMKVCSITFIVWAFWALVLVISYHAVCWQLVSVIRRELNRDMEGALSIMIAVTTTRQMSYSTDQTVGQRRRGSRSDVARESSMHPPSSSSLGSQPMRLGIVKEERLRAGEEGPVLDDDKMFLRLPIEYFDDSMRVPFDLTDVVQEEVEANAATQPSDVHLQVERAAADESSFSSRSPSRLGKWKRFMPNLIMTTKAYETATANANRSGQIQRKELRKAYAYIKIQFAAIGPASICFVGLSVSMAVICFGASEQPYRGGTLFEYALGIALVVLCWVTCLFGGITFVAIALRTYEHVLSNIVVNDPSVAATSTTAGAN